MSNKSFDKRRVVLPALLMLLAVFSMACGLMNTVANGVANKVGNAITGGGDAGTVADLWPDVPKMDGLKQENLDLPPTAKIALGAVMSASMGGKGTINFIAFTTTKTSQDVVDFYTNDKMTTAGWDKSDQPGCIAGNTNSGSSSTSTGGGGFCFFMRNMDNNKQALLGIFTAEDTTTKLTQVFYMRVEGAITTPTP